MKQAVWAFVFVFGLALSASAQEEQKWSVGVGLTPQLNSITTSVYLNKHIGDRWHLGLMPIYIFSKTNCPLFVNYSNHIGLNFNSRYYFTKDNIFNPYAYGFGGYVHNYELQKDLTNTYKSNYHNVDVSVGAGTQIKSGYEGWSLDANIGYFMYSRIGEGFISGTLFYSIGIFMSF